MIDDKFESRIARIESPADRARQYLWDQHVPAWGETVTGDFFNTIAHFPGNVINPSSWPQIEPLRTVEEYVQEVIERKATAKGWSDGPDVAAAVVQKIDSEFLQKANRIIAEINSIVSAGVTEQQQADLLMEKFKAFTNLLYKREG